MPDAIVITSPMDKVIHWRWLKAKAEVLRKEVDAKEVAFTTAKDDLNHIRGLITLLDNVVCKRCSGQGQTFWTISHDMDDVEHGSETCRDCKGSCLSESAMGNTSSDHQQRGKAIPD